MVVPEPKLPRLRNDVLEKLNASFPVFRDCLPLAIGIHKSIREKMPEIEKDQLRTAMKMHTRCTKYLKAISQGQIRFDIDGKPAGEVTAEQRLQSIQELKDRFRKGAERKIAEQQEKERQEKLMKLAEKFNTR